MKRSQFIWLLMGASMLLSGCNKFDDLMLGKDNTQQPAPLMPLQASLDVQPVWSTKTGQGTKGSYSKIVPAIAANAIYTADTKGSVVALDRLTGKPLWQTTVNATIISGPSVAGATLALATANAKVIILDSSNGKTLWSKNVSNEVLAPPTIANGRVFVKTVDGNVYAFDAQSGKKLWKYEHSSPNLILRTGSSPQVSGNLVIAGFSDGKLAGIDATNGTLLWERNIVMPQGASEVERMVDIDANPVIANGVVYVATYHGEVVAMSIANGNILWRHKISTYMGIALTANYVIVPDAHGYVWAFERSSGKVSWHQKQLKGHGLTAPAVYDNYLVVADAEGMLHWLAISDGHFVARTKVGTAAIYAAPVVINKTVYILNSAGNVSAYTVSR